MPRAVAGVKGKAGRRAGPWIGGLGLLAWTARTPPQPHRWM